MTGRDLINADYTVFVTDLKVRIRSARISAARAVNRDLVLLYWDIGRAIVEKQEQLGWGRAVVERLAGDLQAAFPNTQGFSAQNLWRMRQFYADYTAPEFFEQVQGITELDDGQSRPKDAPEVLSRAVRDLVVQIPWGHHANLLAKIKAPEARFYYLQATARYGWTRNVLLNQIKAAAYERSVNEGKTHNFNLALPAHLAEQAEEALKSSYNLEFLGIGREVRERELENRLIERLQQFILELGYGFCFIGRQYRLILGENEYFIDLLFYHRFLKTLVAVELKVGVFEPEFAGKMDFYLNLLNEKERAADDQPSIGIILCAEKDDVVVEFSLKSKTNPIGVAEYKLTDRLPKELKGKLPSEKALRDALLM